MERRFGKVAFIASFCWLAPPRRVTKLQKKAQAQNIAGPQFILQKRFREARQAFEQAIALQPPYPDVPKHHMNTGRGGSDSDSGSSDGDGGDASGGFIELFPFLGRAVLSRC